MIPRAITSDQNLYNIFYVDKHKKTKLNWNFLASTCLINVIEGKSKVVQEILASFLQGIILVEASKSGTVSIAAI